MFKSKNEPWLYNLLLHEVKLSKFADKILEIELLPSCNKDICQRIRILLKEWLNEDWSVIATEIADENYTLAEQYVNEEDKVKEAALNSPAMQEVKAAFPEAEVINIKKLS